MATLAALIRRLGIRSEVGAPVVVDGQVWGALIAGTDQPEPLPRRHRAPPRRVSPELIATAVSNATARAELLASRARVVTAADEQRRRVVRDLHDGAQQRLVHAAMTLQLATALDASDPEHQRFVSDALEHTRARRSRSCASSPTASTLRCSPAAGSRPRSRRSRIALRCRCVVDIPDERYPASVESAAYFVAAEALTNVAKYANATTARITATRAADCLVLTIEDDGVGGARPSRGSGLAGLQDRVAAIDGTLTVESPLGAGTRVRAEIPLRAPTSTEPVAGSLMADT